MFNGFADAHTTTKREFQKWAPQMNLITYMGTKTSRYSRMSGARADLSRESIRTWEFYGHGRKTPVFNVLLTTYEFVQKDSAFLQPIHWACLVVDEVGAL